MSQSHPSVFYHCNSFKFNECFLLLDKGQREGDEAEPCWLLHIVWCLHRGWCCRATALPRAPAGSGCHEAAEGSPTQRGVPSTEGQRALQWTSEAVPSSGYTPLFWPSRPRLWLRGLAGARHQHKCNRSPRYSVSTTDWNRVPRGVGQKAFTVLSSWAPMC